MRKRSDAELNQYIGQPATPAPSPPQKTSSGKKGGRGRFPMLNQFVDRTLRNIDSTTATVWFVLFRDVKRDGLAKTAETDIARRAGKSVRTVSAAVQKLKKLGLVEVVNRGRLKKGPSEYRVHPMVQKQAH